MYRPNFEHDEFHKPVKHYEIKTGEKVILYAYIRKNASSLFKQVMLEVKSKGIKSEKSIYFQMHKKKYASKIFVYRDPIDRILSTFLNKFVNDTYSKDIKQNFFACSGKTSLNDVCFLDFVDYLDNSFEKIDKHLHPQKSSLWGIKYDYPININSLNSAMTHILQKDSLNSHFQKKNNSTKQGKPVLDKLISCKKIRDIRAMRESFDFHVENFVTLDVADFLKHKYKQDYKMIAEIEAHP